MPQPDILTISNEVQPFSLAPQRPENAHGLIGNRENAENAPERQGKIFKTCKQCGTMASSNAKRYCTCGYDYSRGRTGMRAYFAPV